MEIAFRIRSLRSLCESEDVMRQAFGPDAAKALKVCLADLRAAETINDVLSATVAEVPQTRGHSLSITPSRGFRLVVCANHVENPRQPNGKVDWSSISRIKIMSIEQHA